MTDMTRRTFVALGAGALAASALPVSLYRRRVLVRRRIPVMGTVGEVAVVHSDKRYAHAAIDAAFDELLWVDRTMSRFRTDSDIGRANEGAATEGVTLSAASTFVVSAALSWAEASEGAFDPTIGSAVELWDVKNRHTPPNPRETSRLAGRKLYRAVDLDGRSRRIRYLDPDVSLDLGGIAKGYGVDRAVGALRDWGIEDGLVNVGGDLYALGRSQDGDEWNIGIRDPEKPDRMAATVKVSDEALATSGDYLQYFTYRGRRYHHLLDPETGAPRIALRRSLTVAAPDCITADGACTALFGIESRDALSGLGTPAARVRVLASM